MSADPAPYLSGGILACLLLGRGAFLDASLGTQCMVAMLVGFAAMALTVLTSPRRTWTAGYWLVTVLALFHLGIPTIITIAGRLPQRTAAYVATWFRDDGPTAEALFLSSLAVAAFAFGFALSAAMTKPTRSAADPSANARGFVPLGVGLVATGVTLVMGYIATTAPGLLLGGARGTYLTVTAGSPFHTRGVAFVAFGAILLAAAPSSRPRTFGLSVAGVFATWSLLVGDRTTSLYMILAVVVTLARVRQMPRARVAVAATLAGLVLIGVVGQVRETGPTGQSLADASLGLSAPVAEMGASIRPVIEVVTWANRGEEPAGGSTYVAFVERAWERALGKPREAGGLDQRYAGSELAARIDVYQIGYSSVAEAYRNWHTPGVLGVFLLMGVAIGRLDHRRLGGARAAVVVGFVSYALLYHVRQSSNSVIPTLIACVVLIWVASLFPKKSPDRVGALN